MDDGRRETDELLEEMEKRIAKEYAQAAAEMQTKLDDYLKAFARKDAEKQKLVAEGLMSQKEYERWRVGQIMIGQRWTEMRDTLAEDMHNSNLIARSIVNGYMPDVYALNHNYGTFEVEKGSLIDTSYTLYDRQTAERLMREGDILKTNIGKTTEDALQEAFKRTGKDFHWQQGQIQSVTFQAIVQGESIPNMARRIATTMGSINKAATVRYARTATTAAENAGRVDSYKRAEEMGIKTSQMWIAVHDMRTRYSHRQMDREVRPVGETFSNGCEYPGDPSGPDEEIWNCFVGETKVATDSDIISSYKHKYAGDLIVIKSAGGVEFTCTPNHPVLTPRGWVRASALNKGDDILVTLVGEFNSSWVNPDVNHVFPSMKTVHKLMDVFATERASGLSVNFHGDAATANVEVVSKERFLRNNANPGAEQSRGKLFLENSSAFVFCKRHLVSCFWRVYASTLCFVRSAGKSLSFFGRSLSHSKVHSLGSVSGGNPSLPEYAINHLPAATMVRGELLDRLAGKVFVDHIIDVNVFSRSAHVYNLQTDSGYYFVNNNISQIRQKGNGIAAIVKNCRCSLRAVVDGLEPQAWKYRSDEALGGMTYEEWKAGKDLPKSRKKSRAQAEN